MGRSLLGSVGTSAPGRGVAAIRRRATAAIWKTLLVYVQ